MTAPAWKAVSLALPDTFSGLTEAEGDQEWKLADPYDENNSSAK
jgi:hypothetical protein